MVDVTTQIKDAPEGIRIERTPEGNVTLSVGKNTTDKLMGQLQNIVLGAHTERFLKEKTGSSLSQVTATSSNFL